MMFYKVKKMAKSFDKMTKDELLEYKKEVEKKLKEKEQAELLVANECKQIGFTALMSYAKNNADFALMMVKALDQKLGTNEKKRLQNVLDELNSFVPVAPVPTVQQQQNFGVVGVQSEQLQNNFNRVM